MSPTSHAADDVSNPPSSTAAPSPAVDSADVYKPSGRKRRASGTASRGVANLTPEQLAKKRANDREAQRAIRERTKNQIESLERRIAELTAQRPYQELQHAIRQKELVEAENAEIKKRLVSILNLIQPLVSGNALLAETLSPASYNHQPPYARTSPHVAPPHRETQPDHYAGPNLNLTSGPPLSRPSFSTWHNSIAPTPPVSEAQGQPPSSDTQSKEELGAPGLLRTTSAERVALGLLPVGRPEIQSGAHVGEGKTGNGPALPADSHITLSAPQPRSPQNHYSYRGDRRPPWAQVPSNCTASCMLDQILMDHVNERRQRAAEGMPEAELLGTYEPDYMILQSPDAPINCDPTSKVLSGILSTFPDISGAPEKIATYYIMWLTMRWHYCATKENFDRTPDWIRPTSWQIMTPHPMWIDHVPWPEMRDELVQHYDRYPFENFFVPFTRTVSINWPYGNATLYETKPRTNELRLNPTYEAHMRDLNNWSLGTEFAQQYPLLVSSVRIEDRKA